MKLSSFIKLSSATNVAKVYGIQNMRKLFRDAMDDVTDNIIQPVETLKPKQKGH
jgi:hypothetical protein